METSQSRNYGGRHTKIKEANMDTLRVRARCAQRGIRVTALKNKESNAPDKPNGYLANLRHNKYRVPTIAIKNTVDIKVAKVLRLVS
jgi:hypothetical protein